MLLKLFSLLSALLVMSSCYAYQVDNYSKVVTVSPNPTPQENSTDINGALSYLSSRVDKTTPWVLKLNPGTYTLNKQLRSTSLENTTVMSADVNSPAKLVKMSGWDSATSGEYILSFRFCKSTKLIGLEFYGQTDYANSNSYYWPDQGVYFGSCNIVRVDNNKFYNFGNAALRVVTDQNDPVMGVNSFKTYVVNNTFDNIYQTSTTSVDSVHGGTAYSTWANNKFTRVHGAIKFATRTTGAKTIEFINNMVDGGDHYGLEINNYYDFLIKGNTIKNIKEVAINIYTADVPNQFDWGDKFTISNNFITDVGRGIRYNHKPYATGYQNIPQNIIVDNNVIMNVAETLTWMPAIWFYGGQVSGLQITNNKLYSLTNNNGIRVLDTPTDSYLIQNNTLDGLPYTP